MLVMYSVSKDHADLSRQRLKDKIENKHAVTKSDTEEQLRILKENRSSIVDNDEPNIRPVPIQPSI